MKYPRIGVMCGSSEACEKKYFDLAHDLGTHLAKAGHSVTYGGGKKGLMRRVADGALENGGEVLGVMPHFMKEVEWHHDQVTTLHFTEDMATRKQMMMQESDATIFLPGGCGTMEEFFEWLSAKRLGHYTGPLVVVNLDGYYNPLSNLLNHMIQERFHAPVHERMYTFINSLNELPQALEDAPKWDAGAIKHAAVK
jgi:uncharacterized protein (TIGR00730 family)